jgi:hypothetical protein
LIEPVNPVQVISWCALNRDFPAEDGDNRGCGASPDIGPFEMMSKRENQHTGIPAKALEKGRKSE